ncbi:hypothetical protein BT96DRAFT_936013 [Gymnopus androsaceus JB14]|uniref:Uncharacterized protein n=1 Tax=Gymnopus androsaceus JB14 TaxID=1447944 RepID=A0A6A4HXF3_9AGAR|nr:hypothetical protein BT96DRAFT_936013 [Gymnopus androsaceus JB14]
MFTCYLLSLLKFMMKKMQGVRQSHQSYSNFSKTFPQDSVVVTSHFEDVKIAFVDIKNEIDIGHGDPSLDSPVEKHGLKKNSRSFRITSCCPTFLITVAGPHIMVSGSVFSDKFIVQHLTPFLSLYVQILQEYHQVQLVQKCLADFTQYYQTLPYTQSSLPLPSRYFPYIPKAVDVPGLKFNHCLIPQDPLRAIFAAWDANGRELIVKYAKTYGEEAHRLLATKGLAPELLHCCDIPGGLKMVIMACIQRQEYCRNVSQ